MNKKLFKSAFVINEGSTQVLDVLVVGERIEKIASSISADSTMEVINCEGKYLIPGAIDDQVHFREPGLTHKGQIMTESRAAAAGGVTSYMEMPNTVPNALTQELLEDKFQRANQVSAVNYSFFMGASNDNYEEVMKTDGKNICGVKIFMGSSTGNMLVDNTQVLDRLFANVPWLIATHCEDEATVRANLEIYKEKYGDAIPVTAHPLIRSEEACYLSSSSAVNLAKKNGTRLHVLHISTGKETYLFDNTLLLKDKKITSEACIHHLWFTDADYETKGNLIKWNPAVKTAADRDEIWKALLENRIDVIATDHAPHTLEEKSQSYSGAPSGGPLVQHSILAMLEASLEGKISKERVIEKMCHAPAELFRVDERGYIREGYFADLVVVEPNKKYEVTKASLLYQCGWSPFEGVTFNHKIAQTYVNGNLVWDGEAVNTSIIGKRLSFHV
ncbi:MAG: dihydroorotase [Fluviicola sp.]